MKKVIFLKPSEDDLMKATRLETITVPAYVRHDGTVVPAHTKRVHVNPEVSKEDVLSGRGSASQREAHRRAPRMISGWHALHEDHRHAHLLSLATDIQLDRSRSAAMSGWRDAARRGQNPTAGQWEAFRALSPERRQQELEAVRGAVGDTLHLREGLDFGQATPPAAEPAAAPAEVAIPDNVRRNIDNLLRRLRDELDSITDPDERRAAQTYVVREMPGVDGLTLTTEERGNSVALNSLRAPDEPVTVRQAGGSSGHAIPRRPQESDTKVKNGVTYVLRDGRWHRQGLDEPETAPVPASLAALQAENAAPPAEPLPAAEQSAVQAAMAAVPQPDFQPPPEMDHHVHGRALGRLAELRLLASAGDLDGVTNFVVPVESSSVHGLIAGYRTALLEAAHQARVQSGDAAVSDPPAATGASVPGPPEITGANPNNTALVAARRKAGLLHQAALSDNPIEALLAIRTSRGNGYLNRVDDYKQQLLAHFGYSASGVATTEVAVQHPTTPVPRPRRRAPTLPASADVPVEQDISIAVNPDGKTVAQLGFVPRPNVPLDWTVRNEGVNHPVVGLIPWPDDRMRQLAQRYLAQSTTNQQSAKDYQARVADRLPALHPAFQDVAARQAEIAEQRRQAQEAERRRQQEEAAAEQRRLMERVRSSSAAFLDKLDALPDLHQPQSPVGGNVTSYSGDFVEAGTLLGVSGDAMKLAVGRMIADYGNGVQFSVRINSDQSNGEVSVAFVGNDGTSITRRFQKDRTGKYYVYHAYFTAGQRGEGSGKGLFRTSLGVYQSLGITKVKVHANIDVGGYAWAKYGFKVNPSEWEIMRQRFLSRVDQGYETFSSEAVKNRVRDILNDPDPRAMFELSDAKDGDESIGKRFLLNTSWHGTLDLKDAVSKRRVLGYIARGR